MQHDQELAFAKINLALHVRARRPNGYHEIETIFAFLDRGDVLSVQSAEDISLDFSGPFAAELGPGTDNLVMRMAHLLKDHWGVQQGAALHLDKRLPVASGIGGGSADAAAAARLLNRFWDLDASEKELAELAGGLGADIPACILSETAIGLGTGTDLQPVDGSGLACTACLLVNPLKPVSTAAIFDNWDGVDCGALAAASVLEAAHAGRNDLQPMATALCPEIGEILAVLEQTDPLLARMSGSGATCFGLYRDTRCRDDAARVVAAYNPHWWTLVGELR